MQNLRLAPTWHTEQWFNTPNPIILESLRGKVVMLHAFQMLCPGCVLKAIPQARKVAHLFRDAPLEVIGLHTVFEHHDAMKPESLEAFLHEFGVEFPVGVDQSVPNQSIPKTMAAYGMQGTPTTVLIDSQGYIRKQLFGVHDDLLLGSEIESLLNEIKETPNPSQIVTQVELPGPGSCESGQCRIE